MALQLEIFFLLVITSIVVAYCALEDEFVSRSQPLKTIRVKDGDIIDCIDIYKQPAFKHPALKNHTIQMKPTYLLKRDSTSTQNSSIRGASQVWHKYGSCLNGTIPIRRILTNRQSSRTNIYRKVIFTPNHSFSTAATQGFSYSGAQANMKVWNPYVESNNDYSSSAVMLRNGPLRSFETVEAGWTVNPIVYKDTKTRLFAYWTIDASKSTGCFDLTCPGFVQTSHDILLGGDVGTYFGSEITIQIHKDPYTLNWWLRFNNKEIGYWPGDLFPILKHQAVLVQWGGEVYSPKVGTTPHTATAMGSGKFADWVGGRSGSMKAMRIEENSHPLKLPETLDPSSDEWDCYDAYLHQDYVPEPEFYFGGPGSKFNPLCP